MTSMMICDRICCLCLHHQLSDTPYNCHCLRGGRGTYDNNALPRSLLSSSSLTLSSRVFSSCPEPSPAPDPEAVASRRATSRDSMYRLLSALSLTREAPDEMRDETMPTSQACCEMREILFRRLERQRLLYIATGTIPKALCVRERSI
jgi:hypothetical protein